MLLPILALLLPLTDDPETPSPAEATLAYLQQLTLIQEEFNRLPNINLIGVTTLNATIDKLSRAINLPHDGVDPEVVAFSRDYRNVLTTFVPRFASKPDLIGAMRNTQLWKELFEAIDPFLARWHQIMVALPERHPEQRAALSETLGHSNYTSPDDDCYEFFYESVGTPDPQISADFLARSLETPRYTALVNWALCIPSEALVTLRQIRGRSARMRSSFSSGLLPSTAKAANTLRGLDVSLYTHLTLYHLGLRWGQTYHKRQLPNLRLPVVFRDYILTKLKNGRYRLASSEDVNALIERFFQQARQDLQAAISDISKHLPHEQVRLEQLLNSRFSTPSGKQ